MYFINTTGQKSRCGVHNFGLDAYEAIKSLGIIYTDDLNNLPRNDMYIFNYHPSTNLGALNREWLSELGGKSIGFLHDPYNNPDFFDIKARLDPSFEDSHPFYSLPRIIRDYAFFPLVDRSIIKVSTWGYGLGHKNYDFIINKVEKELNGAIIRLHIPFSDWCDADGVQARAIAERCRSLVKNNSIEITHNYMDNIDFIRWANESTINVFSCDERIVAGISSCIDTALMAKRPIGVNKCMMYKNIWGPQTSLEQNTLMEIVAYENILCDKDGDSYLNIFRKTWTEENFRNRMRCLIGKIQL